MDWTQAPVARWPWSRPLSLHSPGGSGVALSPGVAFTRSGRSQRSWVLLDSFPPGQEKSWLETRRKGHKGHGGKARRGGLACHAGGGRSVRCRQLVRGGEERGEAAFHAPPCLLRALFWGKSLKSPPRAEPPRPLWGWPCSWGAFYPTPRRPRALGGKRWQHGPAGVGQDAFPRGRCGPRTPPSTPAGRWAPPSRGRSSRPSQPGRGKSPPGI